MAEAASLTLAVAQRFDGGFSIDARLDVQMAPGSVLVLFGPSGAGKTTILRQIAGLERPAVGVIRFGGEAWCDTAQGTWRPPQDRRIGLVFQEPTLFPHLTVRDNIAYGVRSGSDVDLTPVAEIASMLGIGDLNNRYPRALSGGEAQRVALARALAPDPAILVADEPTGNLDEATGKQIVDLLFTKHAERGMTLVLVTHDNSLAQRCDRVVRLRSGRIDGHPAS
jgi:putative ABC transport system ATP-binding protein